MSEYEVFIGSCMTNIGHFRAAGEMLADHPGPVDDRLAKTSSTLLGNWFQAFFGRLPQFQQRLLHKVLGRGNP